MREFHLSDLWAIGLAVVLFFTFLNREAVAEWIRAGWLCYVVLRAGSEGDQGGSSTGAGRLVLPQQHQVASGLVPDLASVKIYLKQHNVSDQDAIDILALLRRSNGDNLISANKIRDIVGGNEAAVKAQVATLRPKPPAPRTQGHQERPVGGW